MSGITRKYIFLNFQQKPDTISTYCDIFRADLFTNSNLLIFIVIIVIILGPAEKHALAHNVPVCHRGQSALLRSVFIARQHTEADIYSNSVRPFVCLPVRDVRVLDKTAKHISQFFSPYGGPIILV